MNFRSLAAVAVALTLVAGVGVALAGGPTVPTITQREPHVWTGQHTFDKTPQVTNGAGATPQYAVVGHTISDGGTPQMAVETKVAQLASGTLAWTFTQAFSAAPVCVCGDTVADAGISCNIGGLSVSGATITGTLVAVCDCICIGAR